MTDDKEEKVKEGKDVAARERLRRCQQLSEKAALIKAGRRKWVKLQMSAVFFRLCEQNSSKMHKRIINMCPTSAQKKPDCVSLLSAD